MDNSVKIWWRNEMGRVYGRECRNVCVNRVRDGRKSFRDVSRV